LAIQVSFIVVLGLGAPGWCLARSTSARVAFLLYLYYLLSPMRDLVSAFTQYQVGAAAIARIREVESMPAEQLDPSEAIGDARPAAVAFENVRFSYQPDLPGVHHDVSFAIPARGMTAFVGPSGAGKTTVFSLIERFYEPASGRVLLDGTDVTQWPLTDLRAAIATSNRMRRCCPARCETIWSSVRRTPPTTRCRRYSGSLDWTD
jgi:ATP-binding cassette subfamily C protein